MRFIGLHIGKDRRPQLGSHANAEIPVCLVVLNNELSSLLICNGDFRCSFSGNTFPNQIPIGRRSVLVCLNIQLFTGSFQHHSNFGVLVLVIYRNILDHTAKQSGRLPRRSSDNLCLTGFVRPLGNLVCAFVIHLSDNGAKAKHIGAMINVQVENFGKGEQPHRNIQMGNNLHLIHRRSPPPQLSLEYSVFPSFLP